MRLPIEIVECISSFNGSQSELNCERGLRYMFLFCGKFFSWGLGNREETLHEFLHLYQPSQKSIKNLVKLLLAQEKSWRELESHWATEFKVKAILSKISINDKDSSHKNKLLAWKTSVQNEQRNNY